MVDAQLLAYPLEGHFRIRAYFFQGFILNVTTQSRNPCGLTDGYHLSSHYHASYTVKKLFSVALVKF